VNARAAATRPTLPIIRRRGTSLRGAAQIEAEDTPPNVFRAKPFSATELHGRGAHGSNS